jgi:hypothetical protein
MDLIDAFVRKEMSAEDQRRFEMGFLCAPENRAKVEEGRIFHTSLNALRTKKAKSAFHIPVITDWLANLGAAGRPVFAVAALALVCVAGFGLWRILKGYKDQTAKQIPPAQQPQNQYSQTPKYQIAEASPTPFELTNKALPKTEPEVVTKGTWLYRKGNPSGLAGSGDILILIRGNEKNLRFLYEVKNRNQLEVSIRDLSGTKVYPPTEVKPQLVRDGKSLRPSVVLDVPTENFQDGHKYIFEISEPLSSKNFAIKKVGANKSSPKTP